MTKFFDEDENDDIISFLMKYILSLTDENYIKELRYKILKKMIKDLYDELKEDRNFFRIYDMLIDTDEGHIMIVNNQFLISGMKRYIKVLNGWVLFKYIILYYQVEKEYVIKESHVYMSFDKNKSSYVLKLEKDDKEIYVHYSGEIPDEVLRELFI